MAFSEELAERVRGVVAGRDGVDERRLFGGLAWMLHGNLACCAQGDGLIVRLTPEDAAAALADPVVTPMRSGSRASRTFVVVAAAGLAAPADLARWVDAGFTRAAALPPK